MGGRSKKVDKRRQLALPSLPDWWKGGLLHEKRWKNSGRVRKVKKAVSLPFLPHRLVELSSYYG